MAIRMETDRKLNSTTDKQTIKLPVAEREEGILKEAPSEGGELEKALNGVTAESEKLDQARAGAAVIEAVQVMTKEQQKELEKAQETSQENKRENTEKSRDTATVSTENRRLSGALRTNKAVLAWVLEMEAKLWEELLNWFPDPEGSTPEIAEQLKQLSVLYRQLLNAIMKNTSGEQAAAQLERLNQALSAKLNNLVDSSMKETFQFFESFGGIRDISDFKSSLFYHVTGQTLSPKEAASFWESGQGGKVRADVRQTSYSSTERGGLAGRNSGGFTDRSAGSLAGKGAAAFVGGGSGQSTGKSTGDFAGKGADDLPGRSTGSFASSSERNVRAFSNTAVSGNERPISTLPGKARIYSEYAARGRKDMLSSQEQGLLRAARGGINKAQGVEANISMSKGTIYNVMDLAKSENFLGYLSKEGNLFTSREITARNDEILGCMAAITSMKTQVFTSYSGIGKNMRTTLKSAMDRLIDYYISRADREREDSAGYVPDRQKNVYKVYYQIMNQYQSNKVPAETLERAVMLAASQFDEKKAVSGEKKSEHYSEGKGFFMSVLGRLDVDAERKEGKRLLVKDWKKYLKSMGLEDEKKLDAEWVDRSPWGMIVIPEKWRMPFKKGAFFVAASLAAVGLILAYSALVR